MTIHPKVVGGVIHQHSEVVLALVQGRLDWAALVKVDQLKAEQGFLLSGPKLVLIS